MLQHAGACLRELVRSHAGHVPDTKPALRKLDAVEVVRQKRDAGTQDVAFGARPFILCGLPIRRLPEGAPILPAQRQILPGSGSAPGLRRAVRARSADPLVDRDSSRPPAKPNHRVRECRADSPRVGSSPERSPLPPARRWLPSDLRQHDLFRYQRRALSGRGLGLWPSSFL